MARGWESKSVEAQVESALDRKRQRKPQLTPQQIEHETKRDGFLLQRTRILQQIEQCTDPRYRATLKKGLSYLETQLKALGWKK
jgi:hypothetical protein